MRRTTQNAIRGPSGATKPWAWAAGVTLAIAIIIGIAILWRWDGAPVTPNTPTLNDNHSQSTQNQNLIVYATIDRAQPKRYDKVTVSITVRDNNGPVEGAMVELLNHFKTTTSTYTGVTDASGRATIIYNIGSPSPGYEVEVDVLVTHGGRTGKALTAFTPSP